MIRIGLIGDYDLAVTAHAAIRCSLDLAAAEARDQKLEVKWLATDSLARGDLKDLSSFDGLWCVPGSPYASMEGALRAIQFAREENLPFLGTCAGFQHLLIEYARHVLGLTAAEHEETSPQSSCLVISRLGHSLIEKRQAVTIRADTLLHGYYGCSQAAEVYHCNFGPNPVHARLFEDGQLRMSAHDSAGTVHAIELPAHPFYIATLFQPERAGLRGEVHPVVRAFVQAARNTSLARDQLRH